MTRTTHTARHRATTDPTRRNRVVLTAAMLGVVTAGTALADPAVADPVVPDGVAAAAENTARELAGQYAPGADIDGAVDAARDAAVNAGVLTTAGTPVADVPALPAAAAPSSVGQQIADAALSKQGSPYVWGAAGPNSFDCSGLTSWAYAQVGKMIPRTSDAQAYGGTPVSLDALQPGDVVSYYAGASHVAIYIGGGQVVQALNEGSPVQVNDLNYMPVNNAVRF
jgi:cell wall-associated NlpC family hydrolase